MHHPWDHVSWLNSFTKGTEPWSAFFFFFLHTNYIHLHTCKYVWENRSDEFSLKTPSLFSHRLVNWPPYSSYSADVWYTEHREDKLCRISGNITEGLVTTNNEEQTTCVCFWELSGVDAVVTAVWAIPVSGVYDADKTARREDIWLGLRWGKCKFYNTKEKTKLLL